jgi:hypothetical protein
MRGRYFGTRDIGVIIRRGCDIVVEPVLLQRTAFFRLHLISDTLRN